MITLYLNFLTMVWWNFFSKYIIFYIVEKSKVEEWSEAGNRWLIEDEFGPMNSSGRRKGKHCKKTGSFIPGNEASLTK